MPRLSKVQSAARQKIRNNGIFTKLNEFEEEMRVRDEVNSIVDALCNGVECMCCEEENLLEDTILDLTELQVEEEWNDEDEEEYTTRKTSQ